MSLPTDTGDTAEKPSMPEAAVVTAVTKMSAPVEELRHVNVAFDQYAQRHPVLSLDAKPEQVVNGAEVPGHLSGADETAPLGSSGSTRNC